MVQRPAARYGVLLILLLQRNTDQSLEVTLLASCPLLKKKEGRGASHAAKRRSAAHVAAAATASAHLWQYLLKFSA